MGLFLAISGDRQLIHPRLFASLQATRQIVLEELFSLMLFRRLLVVFYKDGIYTTARTLGKRLGEWDSLYHVSSGLLTDAQLKTDVNLQIANDLIERAKTEGYLTLPTILAEDSMQTNAKSAKPKRGRPRKPKASDYRLNRWVKACLSRAPITDTAKCHKQLASDSQNQGRKILYAR